MRTRSRCALWGAILAGSVGLAASANAQQTFYSSSFEGSDGGWSATGDWQRGVPGPINIAVAPCDNTTVNFPSVAASGSECWATQLNTCHSVSVTSSLTQTFNLAGWTGVRLKFQEWEDSGGNTFDMCRVLINGTQIYLGSGSVFSWTERDFDIASFADNNSNVTVEFQFISTTVVQRSGWYVDDIRIEGLSPTPGVNYILSVTDSPDPVAINGANITYNCKVVNGGLDASTGGTFTAPLPAGCSFVSGSGASLVGPNIVATIPAIAGSGAQHTFSFELNPPDVDTVVTLNSSVTPNEADTDTSNNSRTNTTTVFTTIAGDLCGNAIDLNAVTFPFNTLIDNELATDDLDPGTCNSLTFGRAGIWFTYTAPSAGVLTFTETGTQDVTWAVYGSCSDTTPLVACTGTDTGQVRAMTAGQTVKLLLSAATSTTLITTDLNVTFGFSVAPANDTCGAAVELNLAGGSVTVDGRAATTDADVTCNSGTGGAFAGVWYHINLGLDSGSLVVSETSAEDVVIVVYSGSCGSLTQLTCSDAEANITTALSASTDYYLMIAKWGTTQPANSYAFTYSVTGIQIGACCVGDNCQIISAGNCAGQSGTYFGANSLCGPGNPNATDSAISAIPDGTDTGQVVGTLTRTIDVTEVGNVSSIDVVTGLTHSWCGDLRLTLTSPNNTSLVLVERPFTTACPAPFTTGADNSNYGGAYRFSDSGSQTLRAAALAVGDVLIPSGTYQASDCAGNVNSLSGAFGGQTMTGTWTLTIDDLDGGDTGTLNGWGLVINGGVTIGCDSGPTPCEIADFNNAGGVTADDIFAFLDAWFAQNGQTGPALTADANGDDSVTADDIFFFLDLWFTYNGQTCP